MSNKITVSAHYINQRLDNYLFRELKNIPKSLIYRLIRKKAIRVNNKASKPDYKLLLNDEISLPNLENINSPDAENKQRSKDNAIKPEIIKNLESRIIYECKDFLIINKPSGMAVHAGSRVSYGVIDILRKLYGKSQYIELVHRLDRDTSGCLLIAKNRLALNDLHIKLKEQEISKTYIALVEGACSNSMRKIEHPLRRSVLQGGERMVKVDYESGKPSLTRIELKAVHNKTSLMFLVPVTGRTHQLRVHMAYEKHPIVGDNKYGNKELNKMIKENTGLSRIFLHAYQLEFLWGKGHKKISVTAPLDDDLENTLKHFGYL